MGGVIDVEPMEYVVARPDPMGRPRSLSLIALARGNVERSVLSIPPEVHADGLYTVGLFLQARQGAATVSFYAGDDHVSDVVVEPGNGWQQVSSQVSGLSKGVNVIARLGRPGETAQVLDQLLLPMKQVEPRPYFLFGDLENAAGLIAAVDDIAGFPRQTARGSFQLTHAILLKHPTRSLYALPVTVFLHHAVVSGQLQVQGQPMLLGPDWNDALPVPLADANVGAQMDAYRKGFAAHAILGPSGELLAPSDSRVQIFEKSLEQLAEELRKDPDRLYGMDPFQFEQLIGHLLKRDGYDVEVTARSGDQGVDVYAVRKRGLGKFLFGAQCKRYKKGSKIEPSVIREMVGTIVLRDLSAGAVVTTSLFGPDAIREASNPKVKIGLVDYHALCRWLLGRAGPA